MIYKCKICEGIYNNKCNDGLHYYHACSTITDEKGEQKERTDKRDENIKDTKNWEGIEIISS
jgi:hypothetical protein